MTLVKVKVTGYVLVPSYESDDMLAQEDAMAQAEAMLPDLELMNMEVDDAKIVAVTHNEADEDALYEAQRDRIRNCFA